MKSYTRDSGVTVKPMDGTLDVDFNLMMYPKSKFNSVRLLRDLGICKSFVNDRGNRVYSPSFEGLRAVTYEIRQAAKAWFVFATYRY